MSTGNGAEKSPAQAGRVQAASSGLRFMRILLVAGAITGVGAAALWMPRPESSRAHGQVLTHTMARGNLTFSVTEQGTLESAENTEIKCRVRGENTIIWVIESGSIVKAGDELVHLDTLAIEDAIAECTKNAHLTRSGAERAQADMKRAELAIPEYREGRYRTQLMNLEKTLTIAKSSHLTAQNMLTHAETMAGRGYVSGLELQEKRFAVTQADLQVDVTETQIKALTDFTKAMEMGTLQGNLNAAQTRYAAEAERSKMEAARRDLALAEFDRCVIRAERGGLVIYPRAEKWKRTPDIEEGATVHQDQILLLMPDLTKMQVKVGVHESIVKRINPGMTAYIRIPGRNMVGEVVTVAPVTRPAIWWGGNVVKYDTIIKLPSIPGLKPGMSAEVKIVVDQNEDVLIIPVTAVVETAQGAFCWIQTADGTERHSLQLGDNDNDCAVVLAGLQPGDSVVLDALASVAEAQTLALKPIDEALPRTPAEQETDHVD